MSKISEKKALEKYPIKIRHALDANKQYREGYTIGYDQAMQDFMEKAEKWLESRLPYCIQNFKNYMQNESEN